ncbi:MAG: DUF1254 domain-containing protein [bacterium]
MKLSFRELSHHFCLGCLTTIAALLFQSAIAAEESVPAIDDVTRTKASAIAHAAYIWGIAPVVSAKIRLNFTRPIQPGTERADWDNAAELNRMGRAKSLANANNREAVGYNNDTLYGVGFFDLDTEPFVILTPDFGTRYWNIMVSDLYNDVIDNIGTLATGSTAPATAMAGPDWRGDLPDDIQKVLRSPTRYALLATRIYVGGEQDLINARALLEKVQVIPLAQFVDPKYVPLEPPQQRPLRTPGSGIPDELAFFEELGNLIMEQRPRKDETFAILGLLREIGITPEKGFAYETLDEATIAGLKDGLAAGKATVSAKIHNLGKTVNGWSVNLNTGRTGNDYLLRAAIAVDIPYANVPEEAVYYIGRLDNHGEQISGRHRYRIRFESDQTPPVGAFWSITLYDLKGHMIDNPIDRYSIGDRTAGVQENAVGSLDILLQHGAPENTSNWLPAPEGEYYLYLRCYLPEKSILEGSWSPPIIERFP